MGLGRQDFTGKKLQVIFQVSNDGAAFRYYFPETDSTVKHIKEEYSTFNFPDSAKAWMQPMSSKPAGRYLPTA